MARRYPLDTGPAFDFLFQRRSRPGSRRSGSAGWGKDWHLHSGPRRGRWRIGRQRQPRSVLGDRSPQAGKARLLVL